MRKYRFRHILIATGTLIVFSVFALWSFNTVSNLLGGPVAEYKHALAAIGLLIMLKLCLTPRHRRSHYGHAQ
jgi:hypothetical protein